MSLLNKMLVAEHRLREVVSDKVDEVRGIADYITGRWRAPQSTGVDDEKRSGKRGRLHE